MAAWTNSGFLRPADLAALRCDPPPAPGSLAPWVTGGHLPRDPQALLVALGWGAGAPVTVCPPGELVGPAWAVPACQGDPEAGVPPWHLVTDGRRWRLYHREAACRAVTYLEVDLAAAGPGDRRLFAALFAPGALAPGGLLARLRQRCQDEEEAAPQRLAAVVLDLWPALAQALGAPDAAGRAADLARRALVGALVAHLAAVRSGHAPGAVLAHLADQGCPLVSGCPPAAAELALAAVGPAAAPAPPHALGAACEALLAHGLAWEGGRAFLMPDRRRRRRAGAYYTPWWLARHLAACALTAVQAPSQPPLQVLDPAAGCGAFLLAALDWITDAQVAVGVRGDPWDLRRQVAAGCLWGVELDPLAAATAEAALWLATVGPGCPLPPYPAGRVRVGNALVGPIPGARDLPPAPAGLGAVDWAAAFDVILGNPPWGAALSEAERRWLRAAYGGPQGPLAGEVNPYIAFGIRSLQLVRPGGTVALVLPEGWLANRSAAPFRRWLLATAQIDAIAVLRKGVFASAPDTVPVLLVARRRPAPGGPCTVRIFGFDRPRRELPHLAWREERQVDPATWAGRPHALFAVCERATLADRWQAMAASCQRLDGGGRLCRLSDGIYKTRLERWVVPPPGEGAIPVLRTAAELDRYRIRWAGWGLPRAALAQLSAGDRARVQAPKLIFHALKKPGMLYRVTCALDAAGGLAASNNFVLLLPLDCPYDLRYLMALCNSRLLNAWYNDHFIQVNIEAFTLGALPIPRLAVCGSPSQRVRDLAPVLAAVDRGDHGAVLAAVEAWLAPGGPAVLVHDLLAEVAGRLAAGPERAGGAGAGVPGAGDREALDRLVDAIVYRLYGLTPAEVAAVEDGFQKGRGSS